MHNFDQATLQRDFPLSYALLAHDELMTPRLVRHFGTVHAHQTAVKDEGQRLIRWSTIFQTMTGEPLLMARLVLYKPVLPASLIHQLLTTERLFGALLIEAGITVRMEERRVFRIDPEGNGDTDQFGRFQKMILTDDSTLICECEEVLSGESQLARRVLYGRR